MSTVDGTNVNSSHLPCPNTVELITLKHQPGSLLKTIDIFETGIRIRELHVEHRDVATYLRALSEDQREQAVIDAIKLGVFCLERARAGQDLDFVRREVEGLLSGVNAALKSLPEETKNQVAAKIGTEE